MNLNTKSVHARFYQAFYAQDDYRMPNNLCDYTHFLLLALLSLPCTFISLLPPANYLVQDIFAYMRRVTHGDAVVMTLARAMVSVMSLVILMILSLFGAELLQYLIPADNEPLFLIISTILAPFVVPLIIALALFAAGSLVWAWEKVKPAKPDKTSAKSTSIVPAYIHAFKNKYCPRIDWKTY
jgi:uncharacterized membrane protein YbhN (UPF0104 family)